MTFDPHPENKALGKEEGQGVSGSLDAEATRPNVLVIPVTETGVPMQAEVPLADGLVNRHIDRAVDPPALSEAKISTPRSFVGVKSELQGL